MARALSLGRGGLLAVLCTGFAWSCAPDTIDLLPMRDARGGQSGQSGSAGAGTGGGTSGMAGVAGASGGVSGGGQGQSEGGSDGLGGSSGTAGSSDTGGSGGCQGAGCGGSGFGGFGGSNCPYTSGCIPCDHDWECPDFKLCDPDLSVCVQCYSDEHCFNDQDSSTRFCFNNRCAECVRDSECTKGDRYKCNTAILRCVECVSDRDCDFDQRCRVGGFCE